MVANLVRRVNHWNRFPVRCSIHTTVSTASALVPRAVSDASRSEALRAYLGRQVLTPGAIAEPPHPALGMVVVIPCRDEPGVLTTLECLGRCRPPRGAVEVVLVFNASERDDERLRRRHRDTLARIHAWRRGNERERLRFHTIDRPRLPARHAGVGLARKIGMDEAVARFCAVDNPGGVIASLDADCLCDDDYLVALEDHFTRHGDTSACTVYFEHDLEGPLSESLYRGIARYELFLRYYRHGLAFAGFPYAHYTIGSCLAVRCEDYARHGGMNRRKAGEDFYFLNKMMAGGGVAELTTTRVMPGVRMSTRTPFGTGQALRGHVTGDPSSGLAYDPRVFRDIAALVRDVDRLAHLPLGVWRPGSSLPRPMSAYLRAAGVVERVAEIRRNSASPASFRKRFFRWFDGFRALKFIHHATRRAYPRRPLETACVTLLDWQGIGPGPDGDTRTLLEYFRDRDRRGLSLTRNSWPVDSHAV